MTKTTGLGAKRIKTVQKLVEFVSNHNLDELEVDGVKIKKSAHTPPPSKVNMADYYKLPSGVSREEVEDLVSLHWSARP